MTKTVTTGHNSLFKNKNREEQSFPLEGVALFNRLGKRLKEFYIAHTLYGGECDG